MKIKSLHARQIFDSRGYPTIECDVTLDDGSIGRAAVPSGASTGSAEALELRDGGEAFDGRGVSKAIENVHNAIAPEVIGFEAWDQFALDKYMCDIDGTENKSRLGANAILAVSLATAKAAAISRNLPLYRHVGEMAGNITFTMPMPMFNILNGGKHASGSTDIQEFLIVPVGAASFPDALEIASSVFHKLHNILALHKYATTVGDEGGYAPALMSGTQEALTLIESAITQAGYRIGDDVGLALDVAASELEDDGAYHFKHENKYVSSDALVSWYEELSQQHPLLSLEDGLGEQDWAGWRTLEKRLGEKIQLVGDDLLVTNTKLLQKAIEQKAANAILIKPNQIGTLTETINAVRMAQDAGWRTIVSHRSGETEDTTIAHLAVGLNTGQIKTGSFSRSERIAKYNELARIYEATQLSLSNPFKHVDN